MTPAAGVPYRPAAAGRQAWFEMVDKVIPNDVLDFLLAHIDSVAELEALLLLRGAPGQTWTESQMSARLYISEPECANVFSRLELAGLCLRTADGIRYRTVIDSVSATVDRLADTYARCLIPVTNVIHHKPPQIQKFADAFIFRKGK